MSQRPTTLKLLASHCPKAIDHYEAGTPQRRDFFAVGTAAHEVLDAIGKAGGVAPSVTAERVCGELLSTGRGAPDPEPPMSPDAVFAGRDLALRYVAEVGLPDHPDAWYEHGFAWTRDWLPTEYGSTDSWFQSRVDVVEIVYDEQSDAWGLCTRDYKTSWVAGADLLDSIQIRAQALSAWLSVDEHASRGFMSCEPDRPIQFIRREVVNLRTLGKWSADLWLDDDDDRAKIELWRADATTAIGAATAHPTGERPARPGFGCTRCPYVMSCQPAAELAQAAGLAGLAPEDIARRHLVAAALAKAIEEIARESSRDEAIDVDGVKVGHAPALSAKPVEDAHRQIWLAWAPDGVGDEVTGHVLGLLKGLGLGVAQVKRAAKLLHPDDRDAQAETRERLLTTTIRSRWGVAK